MIFDNRIWTKRSHAAPRRVTSMCGLSGCFSKRTCSPSASSSRSPAAEDFRTAERSITGKAHSVGCKIALFAEGDAAFIVNLEKSVIVGLTYCGLSLYLRRRHGTGRDSPEVRQAISACFIYAFVYKENGLVFCGSCSRAEHGKDGRAGTDGEVPVSMILRRAKEEFGAVVPLVDASDL